ncbi:hypothetical protein GCM10009727_95850 [Actinomadura napierensis]|uniref:Uncharacterized protein n=1 Tax=Actinomadura napierensis TaxID=267854 RepID=A0ABP5ME64_9ACTN
MRWSVRCTLGIYLIGFTEGTCAHAWDRGHGGIHAHAFAPSALQVFFVALVVLDPLVVLLIARARPAAAALAGTVTGAGVTANWIANWPHRWAAMVGCGSGRRLEAGWCSGAWTGAASRAGGPTGTDGHPDGRYRTWGIRP